MSKPPFSALPHVLAALGGEEVQAWQRVAGGDINEAYALTLKGDRKLFVKTQAQAASFPGIFAAEAKGLEAISKAAADRLSIPAVVAVGPAFLVLEWLELDGGSGMNEQALGVALAHSHQQSSDGFEGYGFSCDTYLGRLKLCNDRHVDWLAFWRDQRLLPLLDALPQAPEVQDLGATLIDHLEQVLGAVNEASVLVHGDLWSGNAGWAAGKPAVYDPAAFYAPREFEFGMTRLFGFGHAFEEGYESVWPLAHGWQERVEVYRLYHLLSHLWHFGGGYEASCLDVLRRLTRRFS